MLDDAGNGAVVGWARRLGAIDQAVEVDIYVNDRFVGRACADLLRLDLVNHEGFGRGRHGFRFVLSPAAALTGPSIRVFAAASGLELVGSPKRIDDPSLSRSAGLRPPSRRVTHQLRRLDTPARSAVTLADQAFAYGRRLAILTECDPAYPDTDPSVSRAMGYVNARLFGGERPWAGHQAFFNLFDAAAEHFAATTAGLPIGADLFAAMTRPFGASGQLTETYLLEMVRRRADLAAPQDERATARLIGRGLDYLYSRALPLDLLGEPCRTWLRQDAWRWDLAIGEVGQIGSAGRSVEALRRAATHIGLDAAVAATGQAATPAPDVMAGVRVISTDYGDSGLSTNTANSLAALERLRVDHDHTRMRLDGARPQAWAEPRPYAVGLIHAQPDDAVELVLRMPPDHAAQRLIGFYMWETERPPAAYSLGLRLVDEVWTGSRFCAAAMAAEGAPGPIEVVGHAVRSPAPDEAFDADAFAGVEAGVFLVYTHFDARSWITRKNPVAAARAFIRAFPNPDERTALLIKTRSRQGAETDQVRAAWDELNDLMQADPRIRLRDADLSPAALAAVLRRSNCYLSLHRAEGFGYGPAEAILSRVPLIVSAYSGSLDFTAAAWLVPCRRREVLPGEFLVSGPGQVWGEPDLEVAARHLRSIFEDQGDAKRRADACHNQVATSLSIDALSARYSRALQRTATYDARRRGDLAPSALETAAASVPGPKRP